MSDVDLGPLIAGVEAEETAHQGDLEATLKTVYELRAALRKLQDDLKDMEQPVREWLNLHPGEVLQDEHGHVAKLQPRSAGIGYSPVLEIYEKAPEIYERLLKLGLLGIESKRERDARTRGELSGIGWEHWWRALDGTPALLVQLKE